MAQRVRGMESSWLEGSGNVGAHSSTAAAPLVARRTRGLVSNAATIFPCSEQERTGSHPVSSTTRSGDEESLGQRRSRYAGGGSHARAVAADALAAVPEIAT